MWIAKRIVTGTVILALIGSAGGCGKSKLSFNAFKVGQTPPGYTATQTGGGEPSSWIVQEDPSAPGGPKVLAQTSSDQTKQRFPVCVYDGISAKDVTVSVQFKPLTGQIDQSGGIIVRYKNKDNYYVARANVLESNVRLYKFVAGKRTQIANMNLKFAAKTWHTLQLQAQGTHFTVTFDGKTFAADDPTFQEAGLIGLWTKADSVTNFSDLKVKITGMDKK